MKIFGVVGSPRKQGNTDILVSKFLEGAKSKKAETEKIFLYDYKINPCKACMGCKKNEKCVQKDDMIALYDKLYKCDLLVLGTPIYWWGPTAQAKAFIDRWYAFGHKGKKSKMKDKKGVLIAPYADSDKSTSDAIVDMFNRSMNWIGMSVVGKVLVTAGEKGEVLKNENALEEAVKLGESLA